MNKVLSILLLLASAAVLHAQETPLPAPYMEKVDFRLGIYGGYGMNFHETNATIFNGGGVCGAFGPGDGRGMIGGVLGEFPLLEQWLDLTANISYAQRDGEFAEAFTSGLPILDPNTNQYVLLERRHAYTSKLPYLLIEMGVRMQPFESVPVYLRTSGAIGFSPQNPAYLQTEEILSPSGVVYPETRQTIRPVASGPIESPQPWIGLSGALGFSVPLSLRLSASPEVSYYFALNDVTPYYHWRLHTAQAGIAVKYNFGTVIEPPPPPEPEPPPIAQPEPEPTYPQVAVGMVTPQKVEMVETIVTETFPILPYIFFDSASAALPARYTRLAQVEREQFNEDNLPHRSLGSYYTMLNVIGLRMTETPDAKLVLKGTTDGREVTAAGAVNTLSRGRAQVVRDYLVNVWGIDSTRITVRTSPTPTFPSNMQYAEGAEENRRVEIIASNDNILQPIVHERFNEYTFQPRAIPLAMNAYSPTGIRNWRLSVMAGSQSVWEQIGTGAPPKQMSMDINDDLADRIGDLIARHDSLVCEFVATDGGGGTSTMRAMIPASKALHPYEVSRLSLIVFDFDKSDIGTQNKRMVSSFIAHTLLASSKSRIIGSTDRLGELDHNKQLSEARAFSVRDLILGLRPDAIITEATGVGPSRLLYDNDLPEGRYYCRTVSVEVQTPIEDLQRLGAVPSP